MSCISFLCWENETEWCPAWQETDKDSDGDGQRRAEIVGGDKRQSQKIINDFFLSFSDLSALRACETQMQNTESIFFSIVGQKKSLLLVDVRTKRREARAIKLADVV